MAFINRIKSCPKCTKVVSSNWRMQKIFSTKFTSCAKSEIPPEVSRSEAYLEASILHRTPKIPRLSRTSLVILSTWYCLAFEHRKVKSEILVFPGESQGCQSRQSPIRNWKIRKISLRPIYEITLLLEQINSKVWGFFVMQRNFCKSKFCGLI